MTNNLEGWLRYCDEPVSPVNYSDRCYLPECYQSEDNSYWLRKVMINSTANNVMFLFYN